MSDSGAKVSESASNLSSSDKKLRLRRKAELKMVTKYDTSILEEREVWFIVDTNWLNKWAVFIEGGSLPGPISTKDLLSEGGISPLPKLQSKIDYRVVCPTVYFLLKEWHGKDLSPEVTRYECDIYSRNVSESDLIHVNVMIQVCTVFHLFLLIKLQSSNFFLTAKNCHHS
jgi:hypothetical protein